jgi:hypothetical protein
VGGNAREDQEGGEQEAAADPEHAREKADRRAKPQHHQEVHRHLGNGQIDLEHGRLENQKPQIRNQKSAALATGF